MSDQQYQLIDLFYRTFAGDIGVLSGQDLSSSRVSATAPLKIYDLTGKVLFNDFSVVGSDNLQIGIVRGSAQGTQLPLLDSILIGTQWFDPPAAAHLATQKVSTANPGADISTPIFVCYGYPRIGVLISATKNSVTTSYVYDAAVGVLVKSWQGALDLSPEAGIVSSLQAPEGQPFYSYIQQLSDAGSGPSPASLQWQALQTIFSPPVVRHNLNKFFTSVSAPPVPYAIRGLMMPVPLKSQKTPVYCAVATAQMMLAFLGLDISQEQIANVMQTDSTGTTSANFIAGFKSLTASKWSASFNGSPDFSSDSQALNMVLPEKSGIPGHARLLRGWREYLFLDANGSVVHTEQFYVVNDPYPVNSGQLVLENVVKPISDFYTNSISLMKAAS